MNNIGKYIETLLIVLQIENSWTIHTKLTTK